MLYTCFTPALHLAGSAAARAVEKVPAGAVAVLSYASAERVIRRVLISASDGARARFLRGAAAMTRPVARLEDVRRRVLEVPMGAGTLRLGINGDDLDLQGAEVPAGLKLTELKPWIPRSP